MSKFIPHCSKVLRISFLFFQINPNPRKISYRTYSPTKLTNAYKAVQEDGMSVRKAATLYGIPLTTLRDRVDKRVSVDTTKSGPEPIFSAFEEAKLVDHIRYMSNMGYGYTRNQVIELASDFAVHLEKREREKPLSRFWYSNFMSRWPELHLVKPRSLSSIRAKCASVDKVQAYYKELEKNLTKYNLKDSPQSIYNIDEKGISTEHKPPNIVCGKEGGSQAITSPRGKNTTIIGCGNALGQQIPPFFIFAGKRKLDHLTEGATPGTDFDVNESGWSNTEIFEKYLKEHFTKYAHLPDKDDEFILVTYDGHASHVSLSLIEWAKEHNIILFLFPPHCSHILQPLDIGCFGPLERIYNKECLSYLRNHPGQVINRLNICQIACKAYSLALSPENLRASFRRAGIYPFNENAVPESKLTPADLYRNQSSQEHLDNIELPINIPTTDNNNNSVEDSESQNSEPLLQPLYTAEPISTKPPQECDNVEPFFDSRTLNLNETKDVKKKSEKQKFCSLIGGHAITENDIHEHIIDYKNKAVEKTEQISKPKQSSCTAKKVTKRKTKDADKENQEPVVTAKCKSVKGKTLKKRKKTDKVKPEPKAKRSLKLVSNSQEAGPSVFYVNDSDDSL